MAQAVTSPTFQGLEQFDSLRPVANAWRAIRAEFLELQPLARTWPERYLHDGRWDVIPLVFDGQPMPAAELAPVTMGAVAAVPGRFIVGFSILRAGCQILPHVGYTDRVWRSHLGLITNDEAFIEVDGERYTWRDGDVVVFDDTRLHHAHNPGATDRVVLILDFAKHGAD